MRTFLLVVFWGLWYANFSTRTLISPLLPLIEDELSISHALAGSIFSFYSMGYTVTLFLSGLLAARIGYKNSIVFGFAVLTAAVFSLQYASTFSSFAAVALLVGMGAGTYLPCAIPLLTTIFAGENWGKAISLHETAATSSILAVPLSQPSRCAFFIGEPFFSSLVLPA